MSGEKSRTVGLLSLSLWKERRERRAICKSPSELFSPSWKPEERDESCFQMQWRKETQPLSRSPPGEKRPAVSSTWARLAVGGGLLTCKKMKIVWIFSAYCKRFREFTYIIPSSRDRPCKHLVSSFPRFVFLRILMHL